MHAPQPPSGQTSTGPQDEARADLVPHLRADLRHAVPAGGAVRTAVTAAVVPRVRALVLYRLAQRCARARGGGLLATWLQGRVLRGCGADLSPWATIGPGLCLVHSSGVVIGSEVVAGANLRVHQGVTLGERGGGAAGQPVLGDDVVLYAGATVAGAVRVGDGASVAAHALVLTDVPARHVAVGTPARTVPAVDAADRPVVDLRDLGHDPSVADLLAGSALGEPPAPRPPAPHGRTEQARRAVRTTRAR